MPSDGVYRQQFGSWGKALKKAGLTPKKSIISPQCRKATIEARRGKVSTSWKGGRIIENGYVLIWFPEHPNANSGRTRSYVPEHRMIMSEIIGRPLLRTEQVHHKNGIRYDNRPENLELWTTSQPSGQRVEDRIKWAKEFLSLYKNPDLLK